MNPPKKGSVNVHNAQEAWSLNAPDLKQQPSIETHRAIETYCLGGEGIPTSWYGHGDDTNLATAQAQGTPTWRSMRAMQDEDRAMFVDMLAFARDQAEIAGHYRLTEGADDGVDVQMPAMDVKDLASLSAALSQLALALQQAEQAGWMTHAHAVEAWAGLMSELDIEINPDEEMAEIDQVEQQGALDDAGTMNDWLVQHGYSTAIEMPAQEPSIGYD